MKSPAKKPPLFYALAQVVFNPIEDMGDHVPTIQSRLRQLGYSDYETERQVWVDVNQQANVRPPDVQSNTRTKWHFWDMERYQGFVLLNNALVFQTARYEDFTGFRKSVLDGLSAVHEVLALDFVQRIGFRYLDAIHDSEEWPLSNQVDQGLLGAANVPGRSSQRAFTETVSEQNGGQLLIRSFVTGSGMTMPPDLDLQKLNLDSELIRKTDKRSLVLDTDYFVNRRRRFDLQDIEQQLDQSHTMLIDAFKQVTTIDARQDLWGTE